MSKSRTRILGILSLAVLTAAAVALLSANARDSQPNLAVSITQFRLNAHERIAAFEVRVASGRIAALPNVPIGWNISVDNDPSWNTKLEGSIRVGAAALDSDFFRDFMLVEKHDSLGLPFQLTGEVVVTKDFDTERRIPLSPGDFSFKPIAAQSHNNN